MRSFSRRNKYGASTVFMAIILSALVIVETVFLSIVKDSDRRLEVSRALKCEAEAILAGYNRDLFRVYGIYAFGPDKVNDEVFAKVVSANSGDELMALECGGLEELDGYALRKAIVSYYSYRSLGMILKEGMEQLSGLLKSVDDTGLLGKINEYMSSGASGYLSDILSGAVKIDSVLSGSGESGDTSSIKDLTRIIDDSRDDVTSFDKDMDITDLRGLTDMVSSLESMVNRSGDTLFSAIDHILIAHYASYNFDCVVDNDADMSIIGERFSDIHDGDLCDSEFIMTGRSGKAGSYAVSAFILAALFAKEFISVYSDASARAKYKTAASLISTAIAILSFGTVVLDPEVIETVLIVIVSLCKAAKGLGELKKGETVAFVEKGGHEFLKLGYRDFMFLFMMFVPDDDLLSHMLTVLKRDYGDLYTGINLVTDYGGTEYDITKSYVMYE